MAILFLTTSENEHAKAVETEVKRRGSDTLRINFDRAGFHSLGFSSNKRTGLQIDGHHILPGDVKGVFVHHPLPPHLKFHGIDKLDSALRASGWRNTLDWLESLLQHAVWMNLPTHSRRSASILRQIQLAKSFGMRCPDSIFTNDLELLKDFVGRHKSAIIKSGPLLGVDLEGNRLLAHLVKLTEFTKDELKASPCLFQEYIDKAFELRIHVVRDKILACKIESQANPETRIDWRNYRLSKTPHLPFELDTNLATYCRNITNGMGLNFGIMDVIITPNGAPVFLECNSQGHWLWIEQLTGLPITATIADALVSNC